VQSSAAYGNPNGIPIFPPTCTLQEMMTFWPPEFLQLIMQHGVAFPALLDALSRRLDMSIFKQANLVNMRFALVNNLVLAPNGSFQSFSLPNQHQPPPQQHHPSAYPHYPHTQLYITHFDIPTIKRLEGEAKTSAMHQAGQIQELAFLATSLSDPSQKEQASKLLQQWV
jgi:hypothetical protein